MVFRSLSIIETSRSATIPANERQDFLGTSSRTEIFNYRDLARGELVGARSHRCLLPACDSETRSSTLRGARQPVPDAPAREFAIAVWELAHRGCSCSPSTVWGVQSRSTDSVTRPPGRVLPWSSSLLRRGPPRRPRLDPLAGGALPLLQMNCFPGPRNPLRGGPRARDGDDASYWARALGRRVCLTGRPWTIRRPPEPVDENQDTALPLASCRESVFLARMEQATCPLVRMAQRGGVRRRTPSLIRLDVGGLERAGRDVLDRLHHDAKLERRLPDARRVRAALSATAP